MVSIVTMRVRISEIVEGDPPSLLYARVVARSDGNQKVFSQMAQIVDATLLRRLRAEVVEDDEVEVTIEQRLEEVLTITLQDFSRLEGTRREMALS